jgi:hypothetical protein
MTGDNPLSKLYGYGIQRARGVPPRKATREADRAEAYAWSLRMAFGGPAQPSPTIAQCLNGGYGWREVECH